MTRQKRELADKTRQIPSEGHSLGKHNDQLHALDVCLLFLCQREYLLIKPKKANVYPMGKLEHQNLREEWVGVVSEPGEELWGRKGI